MTLAERSVEPWRRRLFIPNYQVGEAARYADISTQTVVAWHQGQNGKRFRTLSHKERRMELSYMQLIEVAVVAAFRKAGVPLKRIRAAREYASKTLQAEFPFAEFRFKEEARHLWLDSEQVSGVKPGTVLQADQGGQLTWENIIGRLREFEYEHDGIVIRWYVAGRASPIIIDPRIAFGAPTVGGTPTWIIKGRWNAGEPDSEIAEDFV
jgi:Putative DNA-binding HTH domain